MSEPPSKRTKTFSDNPYLAHMAGESSSQTPSFATSTNGTRVKNPINGLVPRKVTVDQAKTIMVSTPIDAADARTAISTPSKV